MKYRIAQIVEWDRSGQSCIAIIEGNEIVSRHFDYAEARAALRALTK
jgi:hypothetical protein